MPPELLPTPCGTNLGMNPLRCAEQQRHRRDWQEHNQFSSAMNSDPKDRHYWMDEIAFLEARLNGSQGDIDQDDRAACEDALKAAQDNLKNCR